MGLSPEVIQQIDAIMGTTSRPHMIQNWLDDGPVDTGCLEWPISLPGQSHQAGLSQVVRTALASIDATLTVEGLRRDDIQSSARYGERFRTLLASQPMHVQEEYDRWCVQEFGQSFDSAYLRPDILLGHVRSALANSPYFAYKGNLTCTGLSFELSSSDCIVVAPTVDQFDILQIERTMADNYGLETQDIVAKLKVLDSLWGIDIIGASDGSVEFRLKRIPEGKAAQSLGQWLVYFCPDAFGHEAPTAFPTGRMALWWD